MDSFALIDELKPLAGRILDVDTHEMVPAQEWVKVFGEDARPIADQFIRNAESEEQNINTASIPDYAGDTRAITSDIVNVKGARAPGAASIERRIDVMDAMGVKSQLMYPTGLALMAITFYKEADNPAYVSEITGDRRAIAERWFDMYNEWAVGQAGISRRIRPIAALFGSTPEQLLARATQLIKAGIRAVVFIPAGDLPGGRSPAHPDLDPLWSLLAEANCTFTLHIEAEGAPRPGGWRDAPAFKGFMQHGEFNTDPAFLATVHQVYENFLTYMILGGVFDRHPSLRVGIAEVGAHWVGPLKQRLDLWHKMGAKFGRNEDTGVTPPYRLPREPSFYLDQNVRVAPFPFEDVVGYIQNFGLEKVLCFSTDYPHVEGGKDAFSAFFKKLSPLGSEVIEDFFVNNGMLILPD